MVSVIVGVDLTGAMQVMSVGEVITANLTCLIPEVTSGQVTVIWLMLISDCSKEKLNDGTGSPQSQTLRPDPTSSLHCLNLHSCTISIVISTYMGCESIAAIPPPPPPPPPPPVRHYLSGTSIFIRPL